MFLQKGTIPVFLEMADDFFSKIKAHISFQNMEANGQSEKLDFHHQNGITFDHGMAATATNTNIASSTYDHEMADAEATVIGGKQKDQF